MLEPPRKEGNCGNFPSIIKMLDTFFSKAFVFAAGWPAQSFATASKGYY